MFPATLFDYNGVLVDDEHVHLAAFQDTLAPLGIHVDEAAYWDRYIGYDDVGGFEAILRDHGHTVTSELVADLVEKKKPHYLQRARSGLRVFPGAKELVERRRRVGPVGIVSGALRNEIDLGIDVLSVRSSVMHVVAAEDTQRSKPNPEGYLLAIHWLEQSMGPRARRALVIEDSLAGIEAAKAAGLPCVAVAHSYPKQRLEASPADAVFDGILDLSEDALANVYRRLYG